MVQHLKFLGSDHIPLLFRVQRPSLGVGGDRRRPFRFEAQWMRKTECEDIIRDTWSEPAGGDNFEKLFHGIEACQLGLQQWLRGSPKNPSKRIAELRDEISSHLNMEQTSQSKEAITK